jgi:hypothetical protein
MSNSVMIPNVIAATNIDSYNRTGVSALTLYNGNIIGLSTYGAASGEAEVFTGITPNSGTSGLKDLWMVYDPELVWTGSYRGLDPDVRNFVITAGNVFSIFKPQVGDIFTITEDGLSTGTGPAGVATHIKATDAAGVKPIWVNAVDLTAFCAKYIALTYISIGTGAMDTQRTIAYQFEVVSA